MRHLRYAFASSRQASLSLPFDLRHSRYCSLICEGRRGVRFEQPNQLLGWQDQAGASMQSNQRTTTADQRAALEAGPCANASCPCRLPRTDLHSPK